MTEARVGRIGHGNRPAAPAAPLGGRDGEQARAVWPDKVREPDVGFANDTFDDGGLAAMTAADQAVNPATFPSWRFWALVIGGMAMVGAAAVVSLA
ncbi:hypothetical protein GCM10007301_04270 [Azorhizobium oxalatiphilum]|uniref:Uncharacterized protein n=1 Tax=Azorhizobium oxalatiphilum TaxID=980631 RepID=A0A917F5A8_9HYPH|nr:hypothetical protein [Azorhizobium oxalatiphilum]GGF48106.1 hypothetical protein GCM10007301_04270 [Azorhizobium oxalatiphilum]